MDINILRSIVTVALLLIFVGIVWWAFSRRNKHRFEEDALLPFEGDAKPAARSSQK
ncbi:MAG: CcoQ/FixQ family Cbb3-type cytochrome c oxidase assembly chaperone [Burkholderiales bacterium]